MSIFSKVVHVGAQWNRCVSALQQLAIPMQQALIPSYVAIQHTLPAQVAMAAKMRVAMGYQHICSKREHTELYVKSRCESERYTFVACTVPSHEYFTHDVVTMQQHA